MEILYFVSENITGFSVTRDLVNVVYRIRGKWNTRVIPVAWRSLSSAFIKRMNLREEPLNLQGE